MGGAEIELLKTPVENGEDVMQASPPPPFPQPENSVFVWGAQVSSLAFWSPIKNHSKNPCDSGGRRVQWNPPEFLTKLLLF